MNQLTYDQNQAPSWNLHRLMVELGATNFQQSDPTQTTTAKAVMALYDALAAGGGGGAAVWGGITGTITNQADLVAYIAAQIAAIPTPPLPSGETPIAVATTFAGVKTAVAALTSLVAGKKYTTEWGTGSSYNSQTWFAVVTADPSSDQLIPTGTAGLKLTQTG